MFIGKKNLEELEEEEYFMIFAPKLDMMFPYTHLTNEDFHLFVAVKFHMNCYCENLSVRYTICQLITSTKEIYCLSRI